MSPREECGSIPEIIDHIVSLLDLPTLLACLRVNSTWNKAATPYAARSSAYLLMWPFSLQPKQLPECEIAREAFKRNLGHLQALILLDVAAVDIYSSADKLVNLTDLQYLRTQPSSEEANHLMTIIEKNPNLKQIHLYCNPLEGSLYFDNLRQGSKFFYKPEDDQCMWLTRLSAALQPLALTHFTLEGWLEPFVIDMKWILDSLLKSSLKHLKIQADFQDYGLREELKEHYGSSASTDAKNKAEEATVLELEHLHIGLVAAAAPDSVNTNLLFRSIVFPILRKSPKLKHLYVSALHPRHVPELKAILQESCPLIESLEFAPNSKGPDERACTDLILACPRVTKIDNRGYCPWDLTEFAPRILRNPDICLRLQELKLDTKPHEGSSRWIQQLLCSLPNLRVFRQQLDFMELACLNICDLVQSPWVCTRLEELHLAVGSISRRVREEGEGGEREAETVEQRKAKVHQVYEQLGALTRLTSLGICYKILEESPVDFDMTFDTGLEAMGPCLPSLEHFDISQVENLHLGKQELRWMRSIGLDKDCIVLPRRDFEVGGGIWSDDEYEDDEAFEDDEDYEDDEEYDDGEDDEDKSDEDDETADDSAGEDRYGS